MQGKFFNLLIPLTLPFLLLHEACHYFAARALGARAELHWHYAQVRGLQNDWQRVIFKLAPSFAGIVTALMIVALILHFQFHIVLLMALTLWFLIAWQIMCYADFYDVWFFWKYGHWHPNENKIYSLADAFAFRWNPRE